MGTCRIVSKNQVRFLDRTEAAGRLALELQSFRGLCPVVLGIPRGGLPVAAEIARALDGQLDVVLTHKVQFPGSPEAAMGSVTETGKAFTEQLDLSAEHRRYFNEEKARQHEILAARALRYRAILPKLPVSGKIVIVTDDGIATGFTMRAALWAARQEGPGKLIAAIPVGFDAYVKTLSEYADETVCLHAPSGFFSVGQYYTHFEALEDDDILKMLQAERTLRDAGGKR